MYRAVRSAGSGIHTGSDRDAFMAQPAARVARMRSDYAQSVAGPGNRLQNAAIPRIRPHGGTVRLVASDDLDLDAVRAELEARRDRDRQRLGVLAERPELGSAVSFGKRIGDGTSEAVSRLTDIGVGEVLERGLDRTDRALAKLDEGTYGICDRCGGPISLGRLKAMPDSVLCMDCSASERRLPAPRRR
jgi:DnaK suppressor protein